LPLLIEVNDTLLPPQSQVGALSGPVKLVS
jgi:hypothetical protein